MSGKTGRVPVVKTTAEQRDNWNWSTVPMARSPQGFAELPFPWNEAKDDALKAHRSNKEAKAEKGRATASAPPKPPARTARTSAGQVSLPDLAERLGTDSAPSRQRHAELYQMLFHSQRNQPVRMLELTQANQTAAGKDLPSARLWLEYFPQGTLHVLDASDLSDLAQDRLIAHRADPDDGASLCAAVAGVDDFDIILDDASHASHHQQTAFLALFSRLKPGGFYIIEDLRSQPAGLERPGITTTAELFRHFAQDRRFVHSDPKTLAGFVAIAAEISGCILSQVNFDKKRRDQVLIVQKR